MTIKTTLTKNAEILNRVCSLNADENAFKISATKNTQSILGAVDSVQRKDFLNEIHALVTGIVTKMCDIHGLDATQIEFSGLVGTEEPQERLH